MNPAVARGGLIAISASALVLATPLVAGFEGLMNDPYWDVGRVRTVCYGETHGVQERRYSDAECRAMLAKSVAQHGNLIAPCLPANTPVSVQAAFTSAAYNLGPKPFCDTAKPTTIKRRVTATDFRGACEALLLFVYVDKKDCRIKANRCSGIVARRAAERSLCLQDLNRPT